MKNKCRCNNCMAIYDEDIIECPKCQTDRYLMQPFIPGKYDKQLDPRDIKF